MATKQTKRINAALTKWGIDACLQAYILNVKQGEGGTVIEIETGIPKRSQGAAIDAGKIHFTKRSETIQSQCDAVELEHDSARMEVNIKEKP